MSAYRAGWLTTILGVATVGVIAGAVTSPVDLVVTFTAFAVMGALAVAVRLPDAPRDRHRRLRRTLAGAGIAGGSAAAVVGLTTLVGPGALVLAAVLAGGSPWVVDAVRHWTRSVPRPPEHQVDAVVRTLACSSSGLVPFQMVPPAPAKTDEELCRDWCASYRALGATYSGRKFIRIVEERGGYLDELERRNPAGFAAWLASGATAADNPLPYMCLAHVEPLPINWDELIEGQGS
jgi:hypothetical protein